MSVTDKKIHPFAAIARGFVDFTIGSVPINQAAVLFGAVIPYQGYPSGQPPYAIQGFQVENVQVFCTAIVATSQVDVLIGATSVLTGLIVPVAGTVVQGTLSATLANRRGALASQLNMRVTTNGTGTLTNLAVMVTLRPFPLDNEAA